MSFVKFINNGGYTGAIDELHRTHVFEKEKSREKERQRREKRDETLKVSSLGVHTIGHLALWRNWPHIRKCLPSPRYIT